MLVALKFTQEGYISSFPLSPCGYDLVVDTGVEMFRVQVKQAQWEKARKARPGKSGADRAGWFVDLKKKQKVEGKVKSLARPVNHFDVLVVVCEPETVYVIPETLLRVNDATLLGQVKIRPELPETNKGGRQSSVLRWQPYLNQFRLTEWLPERPQRKPTHTDGPKPKKSVQASPALTRAFDRLLGKKCRCGHSQTMHTEGVGRCDFCLMTCRAFQEAS